MRGAAAILLAMAGCSSPGPDLVFVCEADGALTETHVGVAYAVTMGGGAWSLEYTDGQRATYQQAPGETCFTHHDTTATHN